MCTEIANLFDCRHIQNIKLCKFDENIFFDFLGKLFLNHHRTHILTLKLIHPVSLYTTIFLFHFGTILHSALLIFPRNQQFPIASFPQNTA